MNVDGGSQLRIFSGEMFRGNCLYLSLSEREEGESGKKVFPNLGKYHSKQRHYNEIAEGRRDWRRFLGLYAFWMIVRLHFIN